MTPTYVVVSAIVLVFLFVIGVFGTAIYYIYRKYKSIDNHTNKKYSNGKENDEAKTYKDDKKSFKKEIADLGANTLPDSQTIGDMMGKILPFIKRK